MDVADDSDGADGAGRSKARRVEPGRVFVPTILGVPAGNGVGDKNWGGINSYTRLVACCDTYIKAKEGQSSTFIPGVFHMAFTGGRDYCSYHCTTLHPGKTCARNKALIMKAMSEKEARVQRLLRKSEREANLMASSVILQKANKANKNPPKASHKSTAPALPIVPAYVPPPPSGGGAASSQF